MFDKDAHQMLCIRPPRPGRTIAQVTGAADALDISGPAKDGYTVEIFNESDFTLYILCAPTQAVAAALDPNATGGIGVNTIPAAIPANQSKRFNLGNNDLFLGHASPGGAGTMRIELNSDSGTESSRKHVP